MMLLLSIAIGDAKEIFYTNNNKVSFTKEEFEFIKELFYDGYQDLMTFNNYNTLLSNRDISIEEIESNTVSFLRNSKSTYHETQSKYFTIKKSCSNNCIITLVAEWKSNPSIRSYDVIGAYLKDVDLLNTPSTTAANTSSNNSSVEIVSNTNGFGVSVKLPSGGNNMVISQYFKVSNGGTVYGSYQHATSNISLNNSKKYSIATSGYGGVFLFQSSVRNYYDGMQGVYLNV